MRVAYLVAAGGIPVQGPTGASGHVRELVTALRTLGPCRLYAAAAEDHRGRHGPPVPATVTGTPGWPSWLRQWRELREVRASRALARRVLEDAHGGGALDLIIERHSLFSDAAWRVGERLGVPWILEVNAPQVLERQRFEELLQPTLARRWEQQVLRAAPCVVTVSPWLKRWLVEQVGCRPERVHWVPNGVPALRGDRVRGRELLGVGPDEPLVGFLGSDRPWHGVDQLPAVAAECGARLVLLGDYTSPPEDAVAPGFLSGQELADAIAALDVGMAPYPVTAPPWFCPLKIFQYRAQGVPVVATDVGAVRELVKGGGTVVPPGAHGSMVAAVRRWLSPGVRRPRPRVRSWASVARQLLELGRGLAA